MAESFRIRVILRGRTGNNLFQYALGRALSARHGSRLVLDGSLFRPSDWQSVRCIEQLPIQATLERRWSLPSRAVRKFTGKHPCELLARSALREPDDQTGFEPAFLQAPADCVLSGFFQSPRYFESIESDLRRELDLSTLVWATATIEMAQRLSHPESVAVHVRRGDYVGHPVYDLCGLAYYEAAMQRLREQLSKPRFFLFSDDPAWCRSLTTAEDVEVVDLAASRENPLHDLYLMSCCRHQIIANSSYSWWAAWLAKHDHQKVIAPDRWLAGSIQAPISDRICPGWECIAV